MTARRSGGGNFDQGTASPAYREIKKSIVETAERTEALFDRLEKRLDRMDKDVQRTEMGQERLAGELQEMRRDVGELRDATHLAANKAATAAVGVAEDLKVAIKRPIWMKWQAWATAAILFVALYKNFQTFAKDMTSFWRFIIGETPPAVVRPQIEPVVQPRQDTTSSK